MPGAACFGVKRAGFDFFPLPAPDPHPFNSNFQTCNLQHSNNLALHSNDTQQIH
jgi:hypothetical protein